MATVSSLQAGDCVVCRINDNYASGRVFIKSGKKYLANNDYSFADTPVSTKVERFWYRLAFPLSSSQVTGVKKVSLEKLPYKTGDVLKSRTWTDYKLVARTGSLHFLQSEYDNSCVAAYTRAQLDNMNITRATETTPEPEEELTMEQVCAELGRTVKIRRA